MNRRSCLKTSLGLCGAVLLPAGVMSLVGSSGSASDTSLSGIDGRTMGTGYSVRWGDRTTSLDRQSLVHELDTELLTIELSMSTWRPDSQISRFNAGAGDRWHAMSVGALSVLRHAQRLSHASHGAFDVTVAPLVDLWGFGASSELARGFQVPDRDAVLAGLAKVGYRAIDLDENAYRIRKQTADIRIDLSGIAKGHAVDRLAAVLDQHGLRHYLIEVGGELRSHGTGPTGRAWRVAIERPATTQRDPFRVLELSDQSVATSGNYRHFFDRGGQRYSHSIDPRTGYPVRHELASVTVVSDDAVLADALSTAFMVMGPDAAMAYAEEHNLAIHMILKSGDALQEAYSTALEPLLV